MESGCESFVSSESSIDGRLLNPHSRGWEEDDDTNIDFANQLNWDVLDIPIYWTGGNFMTDGYGMGFSTQLMVNENNISNNNIKFQDLKPNSIIGTSSYRREYQLQSIRSDLNYKLIRGNVDTRIKKLENGDYDGILLSKAGIEALGLDNKITQEFNTEELIPCAGQGIIAIQCRENDQEIINILEKINDNQSRIIANAERNVLKILEGDCNTAVGVYAKISKDIINIKAELFSVDGKHRFYVDESENEKMINDLSIKIGEKLKSESKGSYKR